MARVAAVTAKAEVVKPVVRVVGKVVMHKLSGVKANAWNPNHMTPFLKESLKHGLLNDGWMISQSLLVWGTDEKGKRKDVIIDGEHRWTVATELGFKTGPMVFLDSLPEAKAKALTVKMNQKRGQADDGELATLLQNIQFELGSESLALEMGFPEDELMKLLATTTGLPEDEPVEPNGAPPGEVQSGMTTHVRMVQLFFDKQQHEDFLGWVKELAPVYGTQNTTSTVLEAMRHARTVKDARPTSKPHS